MKSFTKNLIVSIMAGIITTSVYFLFSDVFGFLAIYVSLIYLPIRYLILFYINKNYVFKEKKEK